MAQRLIVWIALISASSNAYRGYNPNIHAGQISFVDTSQSHQRSYRQDAGYQANERLPRANERSIPASSELQRVQDEEKRRRDTIRLDSFVRNENGSSKIVNTRTRIHPVLTERMGASATHEGLVMASDDVVFPGPTTKSFMPQITEECRRLGICENVPNYPQEHVNQIIKSLDVAKYKLNKDRLPEIEIKQRISPPTEVSLCNYNEKISIPEALPNEKDEWKFIVNRKDDQALQVFRVEICSDPKGPCDKTYANFRNHKTYCKQQYVRRSMLAVNTINGDVYSEYFKLPSCCSCVIKTDDFDD